MTDQMEERNPDRMEKICLQCQWYVYNVNEKDELFRNIKKWSNIYNYDWQNIYK